MPDMNGPDLSAVGASARSSRGDNAGSKQLTSFSVRKGDNGGVMISESYESKPPEGRRRGSAFPGDYESKENPFGPNDRMAARTHISGLLDMMTGGGTAGQAPRPAAPPAPPPPPRAVPRPMPGPAAAPAGPPLMPE
jgi:hypothetical protein